jgi:hypothetical protein
LQQALLNLALNARDAMPSGGTLAVQVRVERSGSGVGEAVLIVRDTGHGMPTEVLSRIFEPFFTTKPKGQGTGLGLSIIKGIIEDHGGSIAATSVRGEGAEFTIRVPLVRPPQETTLVPSDSQGSAERKMVVLAFQSRHIREILATALTGDGMSVVQVGTAEDLIRRVRASSTRVHGVVVDLGQALGASSIAELRRSGWLGPVLLVGEAHAAETDPCTQQLQKPYAVTTLCGAVRTMMSGRADFGETQ